FRCRSAVAGIVPDAEILLWTGGIVTRRQDDAAERLVFSNDVGSCRSRQDTALSHHHLAEAVGGGNTDGLLDDFAIVETPVPAKHQGLALVAVKRVENRLDEIFRVVLLLEDRHLFAEPCRAGLLVVIGSGCNGADHDQAAFFERSKR